MIAVITIAAGLLIACIGIVLRRSGIRLQATGENDKKPGRRKKIGLLCVVIGLWLAVTTALPLLFGAPHAEPFQVEISPERIMIAGMSVSTTVVTTWIAMGVVLVVALILRLTVIPRMKKVPKGIQNVLELAVDGIHSYTDSKVGNLGENISAYLFSVAVLLVSCAVVELFGARAPTADITMTFALALITFILINYYGIKRKGVVGRIKSLANPTPVVFILRVISDFALPISMACRLFGNMLGGMIVMELLYSALGSSAVGIPSVVGLYFNVFHPLIQAFIFITLTLTFINEAAEIETEQ